MTKTKDATKQFKFEVFAVSLLLCTPSRLNRAWTNNDDIQPVIDTLKMMTLSKELSDRVLDFIANHKGLKGFFKGVADTIKAANPEYSGPDPHPDQGEEAAMIKALQALDKSMGAY